MDTRDRQATSTIFNLALALATATLIVATLAWEMNHSFPMPIHDDIFDRLKYYRASEGGFWTFLEYMFSLHNEHRILTTRLFATLDEAVFGGHEYVQVMATNVIQIGVAVFIYNYVFKRYLLLTQSIYHDVIVWSVLGLCVINPNFFYTLVVPFQLQHAIMAAIVVAGAFAMSEASAGETLSAQTWQRLITRLVGLGILGTVTLGNAPAILIAATGCAVILRWRRERIIWLGGLALAHTALVLATTPSVGNKSYNIIQVLKFSLIYWGAPFMRLEPWPANFATWLPMPYLAGFFGLLVLGGAITFAILRFLRPGLGGRLGIFGLMVLLVVIITGLAAGHSRAQFGILEGANKKYASFAALGWLGLFAVCMGVAEQMRGARAWRQTGVTYAFLLILLPLSISGYLRETRIWQRFIDRNIEDSLAVAFHVNDKSRLGELYQVGPGFAEYIGYIEPRRRSIFGSLPFLWGDDAQAFLKKRTQARCRSEVETVNPVPAADLADFFKADGLPVSMSGWTWMDADEAPAVVVIAVDSKQRIIGAARTTRTSARPEEWLGQKFSGNMGWFGFARLAEPSPVVFYALSGNGKSYCFLGGVGAVR